MIIEDIYLRLPIVFQNIAINIEGLRIRNSRFNNHFQKLLADYNNSDPNQINLNQLSLFIKEANKTPYWSTVFKRANVNYDNSNNIISEINKLPILTKNVVKNNLDGIININRKLQNKIKTVHTSGTTGSGLRFPESIEMENRRWAVWWRFRNQHGISMNTWMGWFGGRSIANVYQKSPPFWRISWPTNQVLFSAHHLNEKTVESYYNEIIKRGIKWLHGYPSQLNWFARLLKRKGLFPLNNIQLVTTGAENLMANQISIIEEVFQAPIRQQYGLAESVANISEDINGNLIPDQDFAFMEFIPVDNRDISVCKIVGTNYYNMVFPLIRYDTGDIVKVKWETNGKINIKSIDGRMEDYITLPNGVKVGRLDHIFKDLVEVIEAQIIQKDAHNIEILIVKSPGYDKSNQEKLVIQESKKRLGNEIKISIKYVNFIPKSKSGKLKFVISKIN